LHQKCWKADQRLIF